MNNRVSTGYFGVTRGAHQGDLLLPSSCSLEYQGVVNLSRDSVQRMS